MTKYGSDAWIEKLAQRRAIRDYYRDKFFNDHGFAKRLKDTADVELAPADQLESVLSEMDKAKGALEGNDTALLMLQFSLVETGLGLPLLPTTPIGRPTTQSMMLSTLASSWFNTGGEQS